MASNLGDEKGGGGPNDEQEDQAMAAMESGLQTLDESSEDSDDYSRTIDDIVNKVMTMNNVNKPLPKLLGRLRQSLPHNTRAAAPAIRHTDDAAHSAVSQREGATPYRNTALWAPSSAHLGYSSTKMVRSVSTPEMSDKYSYWSENHVSEVDGRKPVASRKMDFSTQGVGECPVTESAGVQPLKSVDWCNKENVAPSSSSNWMVWSGDAGGRSLGHQHAFREPVGTNRLAHGFKTPGKPAEFSDKTPFINGSCPKRAMPVVSSSAGRQHHFSSGRQVTLSKHNNPLSRLSTTTTITTVSSSTLSSMTTSTTATTNVMASTRGVIGAWGLLGSTLYPPKHGAAHSGQSSLPCLDEELFPSGALQGVQPLEEAAQQRAGANVNLLRRLSQEEVVTTKVASGQGSVISSGVKCRGSELCQDAQNNELGNNVASGQGSLMSSGIKFRDNDPVTRGAGSSAEKIVPLSRVEVSKEAASSSLEEITCLPTDPNLLSALMKLNSSFDAGHTDSTITSYLARQNTASASVAPPPTTSQLNVSPDSVIHTVPPTTSQLNVSPEVSVIHTVTHKRPVAATAITSSSSQAVHTQQRTNEQFLLPNSYTGREMVSNTNNSSLGQRTLYSTNHRLDNPPSSRPTPLVEHPVQTHPSASSSAVTRQCLSNQATSQHPNAGVELIGQRSSEQGTVTPMLRTANCPAKPTVTFAQESHRDHRVSSAHNVVAYEPLLHTSELARSSHTNEESCTSHTSEAPRTSHTNEAQRTTQSSEAPRTSHTSEASRTSHTSEASRTSHTSETSRTSHTSEASRTSHTSEASRTSHTSEASRTSHTSDTMCTQRPALPVPAAGPSAPSMEPLFVNGKQYLKLSLLGKGGSSEVFEVLCMESHKVLAVKVVQLDGADEQMLAGYRNEIEILKQLQWSNRVIKLYDCEETQSHLRLVMERGSKDLACVLKNARGKGSMPISPFTIQHYWQGMLLAVQAIHQQGIVHSDLKPANFILVGEFLKLIDFGIASSIQNDMTSVHKDSQAGTFNYMSPESLNDVHSGPIMNGQAGDKPVIKIGKKSDVWSLGCILYNLVYSRTPFQHINNTWKKLAAISRPDTVIEFPPCENPHLLNTMQLCLQFHPKSRPSIEELLKHPYLTGVGPAGKSNALPS